MWTHFDGLRTKLLLKIFYDFLIRHFKKRKKVMFFLKSEKTVKYVFSNSVSDHIGRRNASRGEVVKGIGLLISQTSFTSPTDEEQRLFSTFPCRQLSHSHDWIVFVMGVHCAACSGQLHTSSRNQRWRRCTIRSLTSAALFDLSWSYI